MASDGIELAKCGIKFMVLNFFVESYTTWGPWSLSSYRERFNMDDSFFSRWGGFSLTDDKISLLIKDTDRLLTEQ